MFFFMGGGGGGGNLEGGEKKYSILNTYTHSFSFQQFWVWNWKVEVNYCQQFQYLTCVYKCHLDCWGNLKNKVRLTGPCVPTR